MKKVSAIVLTKNEEKNIERCLASLSFCDEIVILDDFSMDNTLKVAKKHKVTVFQRNLDNDFSKQRNFGLSKAKNDWVLFIDSDEVVSEALQKEIVSNIEHDEFDGFYIKRQDILFGKKIKHGDVGGVSLVRLGKKEKGEWNGQVHEVWTIRGNIGKLDNALLHYPHQSISEFISEIDFYSTLRANELFLSKKKSGVFQIIFYPKFKFLKLYILQLGFLDGMSGLIHALLMSLYSFLVRGKLYLHKK